MIGQSIDPDSRYARKAWITDLMYRYAQRWSFEGMVSYLLGPKVGPYLEALEEFSEVFSLATAEREAHRALYHKAFPGCDVFKFPQPQDGSCEYCSQDEYSKGESSPTHDME